MSICWHRSNESPNAAVRSRSVELTHTWPVGARSATSLRDGHADAGDVGAGAARSRRVQPDRDAKVEGRGPLGERQPAAHRWRGRSNVASTVPRLGRVAAYRTITRSPAGAGGAAVSILSREGLYFSSGTWSLISS